MLTAASASLAMRTGKLHDHIHVVPERVVLVREDAFEAVGERECAVATRIIDCLVTVAFYNVRLEHELLSVAQEAAPLRVVANGRVVV